MKKSFTAWALEMFWIACLDGLHPLQRMSIVQNLTRLLELIYPVCFRKVPKGSLTQFEQHGRVGVLVSAGMELIFFLVAGIVLSFGFSMRRMLITHGCFQLLLSGVQTKSRIFQLLLPSQQKAGGAQGVGRGHSQSSDPNWPKGYCIPCDIMPSIETGGTWPGGDHCSGTNWASVSKW